VRDFLPGPRPATTKGQGSTATICVRPRPATRNDWTRY